jgi:beta-mannosidase
MKTQSLTGQWKFRKSDSQEWLPAIVPGGVHTDLLALDRIPDPFVGDNEKKVQWVAESDWDYSTSFNVDPDVFTKAHLFLVCDGLDTLAEVMLNGHRLGSTNNMFRQYRWDVKPLLKAENNELLIAFSSPVRYGAEQQEKRNLPGVTQAIPGGPHIRKAPCHFGWDWGPQLPPIGIWKDIRLEGYEALRIEEVHLRQQHVNGKVSVTADVTLQSWENVSVLALFKLTAPDGEVSVTSASVTNNKASLSIEVSNPQLWWPNGYGAQPLYKVSVEVTQDSMQLDHKEFQMGLRTIELRQKPDEWGKSFTFVVNGLPVFAKGSNWIPADSFPTRISDAYMESLIRDAALTHQNMLRVWGGGFYEEERFYDLCDRYGILIWQDFVFSCSVYPLDDAEFLENVRIESIENIRRLRHRASLALWCGNNEMEWGWVEWGWNQPEVQAFKEPYDRFFHHTLLEWCNDEDPDHTYWPSSPSSDTPFVDPNGQKQGDAHYWDVWHGRKPFSAYRSQFPRFMSEFGFQALPPLETIKTYAEEADWNMTSYIMERHQKNDSGNQLMVAQMLDIFRLPKDFESLVYLSLVLQAEGIRYGVEHWRRNTDRVSGIIYWQLNDCWPVASWSSLDYFGRWKALHYAARKFFAPLLLSIEDKPTEQNVYVTNESREAWQGSLRWSLETLEGKVIKTGNALAQAEPFGVSQIAALNFEDEVTDDLCRDLVFVAELFDGEQLITRQTAFFVPTKHLNLVDAGISTKVSIDKEQVQIEVTSKNLAKLVELNLEGADGVFSDNYFDLPAGRKVTISVPLPGGWTTAQVESALKVRSVYDSYAHGAAK